MSFIISMLIGRGLSSLAAKAIVYGVITMLVGGTLLTIRQHYVNLGWKKAIIAVKKQDDRAAAAADVVDQKAQKCTDTNGYWDVVSQGCKLEEENAK